MRRKPSWAALEKAASERILIIDGAMGTMIQQYKLGEGHYRGERFQDHSKDIKGNNDLLVLTQPAIIEEIHGKYLRAHADIIETNTFNAQRISLADYHMQDLAYEMNVEAAKLARSAADEWTKKTPEKPRFVAGAVGPTNRTASLSPDVNNPGYRNVNFDELRDAYKEQVTGLDRWRRRYHFDRDDLRHPECQSRGLCDARGLRGERPRAADHDFGNDHGSLGKNAIWADRRSVLVFDAAPQAIFDRPQLRARRRADAALTSPSFRMSRMCASRPIRMPVCRTRWASMTRARTKWRARLSLGWPTP